METQFPVHVNYYSNLGLIPFCFRKIIKFASLEFHSTWVFMVSQTFTQFHHDTFRIMNRL